MSDPSPPSPSALRLRESPAELLCGEGAPAFWVSQGEDLGLFAGRLQTVHDRRILAADTRYPYHAERAHLDVAGRALRFIRVGWNSG